MSKAFHGLGVPNFGIANKNGILRTLGLRMVKEPRQ